MNDAMSSRIIPPLAAPPGAPIGDMGMDFLARPHCNWDRRQSGAVAALQATVAFQGSTVPGFQSSAFEPWNRGTLELWNRSAAGFLTPLLLLRLDHRRHVGQQLLRVVDDAVLDRVADAADALDAAGAIVQAQVARCRRAPSGSAADSDRRAPGRPACRRGRCRTAVGCPSARAAPRRRASSRRGSLRADGSRPPAAASISWM